MTQEQKSSKKKTLLRLAFIITTITPFIFNILSRQSHKLLWKKVDAEYINCLRVVLTAMATEERSEINNGEFLSHAHISFYEKSGKIIDAKEREIADFISKQKIFMGEDGKFSTAIYKGFLIKNNITESYLLGVMKEIYCNKLYKDGADEALTMIGSIAKEKLQKIVKSKQIAYNYYLIKDNMLKTREPTEEELKKIYDEKNHPLLFTESTTEGYIVEKSISLQEKNTILITEEAIEEEFKNNKKDYQYKKISIAYINFPNEEKAREVLKLYKSGAKTLANLNEQYLVQGETIDSNENSKTVHQLSMLYQRTGINNPLIFPMPNGEYSLIYITDYQCKDKSLQEVKGQIENKLKYQIILNSNLQQLKVVKAQIATDVSLAKNINYLNTQGIKVTYNNADKNNKELQDMINGDKPYIVKDNHIVVFIPIRKISKHLKSWEEMDKNILKNIFSQKEKKNLKKIEMDRMIPYLLDGTKINSSSAYGIGEVWVQESGIGNILLLLNKNRLTIHNVILSCKRNDLTAKPQNDMIVKTKVLYSNMEFSEHTNGLVRDWINLLLGEMQEEYMFSLYRKIAYFKSISKHQSFIFKYFIN